MNTSMQFIHNLTSRGLMQPVNILCDDCFYLTCILKFCQLLLGFFILRRMLHYWHHVVGNSGRRLNQILVWVIVSGKAFARGGS